MLTAVARRSAAWLWVAVAALAGLFAMHGATPSPVGMMSMSDPGIRGATVVSVPVAAAPVGPAPGAGVDSPPVGDPSAHPPSPAPMSHLCVAVLTTTLLLPALVAWRTRRGAQHHRIRPGTERAIWLARDGPPRQVLRKRSALAVWQL